MQGEAGVHCALPGRGTGAKGQHSSRRDCAIPRPCRDVKRQRVPDKKAMQGTAATTAHWHGLMNIDLAGGWTRGRLPARTRPRGVFHRFRGSRRGGGGSPTPFVDPKPGGRRVRRSATGVPGGGGWGDGWPTYILQNDPDDTLIILKIHKCSAKFFQKNFAH